MNFQSGLEQEYKEAMSAYIKGKKTDENDYANRTAHAYARHSCQ